MDVWIEGWMDNGWMGPWVNEEQLGKQSYVMEDTRSQYNGVEFLLFSVSSCFLDFPHPLQQAHITFMI